MDGDDLRRYNTLGYSAGDDVIRKLHNTLTSTLRPEDFFGRWRMGDEFILIMPDTDTEKAVLVCENLRMTVEKTSEQWLYPTTISGGLASYPKHGVSTNALLLHAETALKAAKKAGKNRVLVAD
jgi:diguanylate cyclase (GGDEF)-like protein